MIFQIIIIQNCSFNENVQTCTKPENPTKDKRAQSFKKRAYCLCKLEYNSTNQSQNLILFNHLYLLGLLFAACNLYTATSLSGTANIFGLICLMSLGFSPVRVFVCLSEYSKNSSPLGACRKGDPKTRTPGPRIPLRT